MPDGKIKISINIPEKLLTELDADRSSTQQNRSGWIVSAIIEKLALMKKKQ